MKKVRNSNIEILRIISMIFIVISHYTVHNGISNASLPLGINRYLLEITTLGNIGVILFVLISGYFMLEQKEFKIKRILSLYLQIVFYSLGIYLLFIIFGLQDFSIKQLIKCALPILFEEYWFMTCYIVLYLLSPFINKFLNHLKRKEHFNFILVIMLLFSIVPTFTTKQLYGNQLTQFIMFYSIGAYLKKYPKNILSNNKKLNKRVLLLTSFLLVLSVIFFDIMGSQYSVFNNHTTYFFQRNSILAILFSISLFNIFINKKEFNNKLINIVSSCTLGVYLIHDNNLVRNVLWTNILKVYKYVNSNYLIIHMILSVIIIFIVCTIIEYIRKNTVEKITNKLIDKLSILENKFKLLYKRLIK